MTKIVMKMDEREKTITAIRARDMSNWRLPNCESAHEQFKLE